MGEFLPKNAPLSQTNIAPLKTSKPSFAFAYLSTQCMECFFNKSAVLSCSLLTRLCLRLCDAANPKKNSQLNQSEKIPPPSQNHRMRRAGKQRPHKLLLSNLSSNPSTAWLALPQNFLLSAMAICGIAHFLTHSVVLSILPMRHPSFEFPKGSIINKTFFS